MKNPLESLSGTIISGLAITVVHIVYMIVMYPPAAGG